MFRLALLALIVHMTRKGTMLFAYIVFVYIAGCHEGYLNKTIILAIVFAVWSLEYCDS